ncbi:hypothetical protein LB456_03010 [Psychroflexus sp. CAK57W]|uniref:hypothetical protein n=1 Tax=Psychroflexus curvus TaxID=2873595 RepID=UPI001CCAF5B3|nr:hypothetical protein [Psychroflexus curvus]MBZ9786416.1 hypothetical protein [Psychroflexus curvus]
MNTSRLRNIISPKAEIAKLKNGIVEYDKAIDDVLNLLNDIHSTCNIIHTETGLLFNGYDSSFPKGKNTLSKTNSKSFRTFKKSDDEILEIAFGGHITEKENGKKFVWNEIVYEGSEINKILSEIYDDTQYIPLDDFSVKKII